MKKTLILFGVFAAIFLMVSTATAVPQVQSRPVIEKVNKAERLKVIFEKITINKFDSKYETQAWSFPIVKLLLAVLAIVIRTILYVIFHPIEMLIEWIKSGIISKIVDWIFNLIVNIIIRGIMNFIFNTIFGTIKDIINGFFGMLSAMLEFFRIIDKINP